MHAPPPDESREPEEHRADRVEALTHSVVDRTEITERVRDIDACAVSFADPSATP